MSGTWSASARACMAGVLLKCQSNGMTPADTAKAIDAAYPFGERAHHPYKVWLRERKQFFALHGLPRNGRSKSQAEELEDLVVRLGAKRGWIGKDTAK